MQDRKHSSTWRHQLVSSLAACLLAASASGVELNISARFRPSVLSPQTVQFENTTPLAGFCRHWPNSCTGKTFSIGLPVNWSYPSLKSGQTDPRKGVYIKVPNTFRTVQVVNTQTGQSSQLRFRVSGMASTYNLTQTASEIVGGGTALDAHNKLWVGSYWNYPSGNCTMLTNTWLSDKWASALWGYPESAGGCYKQAAYTIASPGVSMTDTGLMYELQTPSPLELGNGEYKGSLEYRIGPGQDFDFGDTATADASLVKINFVLSVAHELKVNYPDNALQVLLEPAGGWSVWLQQGRAPGPLQRNIPFTVASSGNFSVRLECQYTVGSHCGIANGKQLVVPVATALSMEGLREKISGQKAARTPLSNAVAVVFGSQAASAARRSQLHFTVAAPDVTAMAKQSGERFVGTVTLVFDAGAI
ncbi:hypothetical protein DBR44_00785 [Aquitalea sp. FJL05]|uniref:hypothetical protein n=1 Tax=Aquitalea sp. FJL05 TaxID=2153366 RepID=UPI000F595975|nr:hypothetical protein [Aquitalea sp. FJL05]RQO78315.1 hypothetical protein DBR44_00785 [Aquitalea sp. FJL05]